MKAATRDTRIRYKRNTKNGKYYPSNILSSIELAVDRAFNGAILLERCGRYCLLKRKGIPVRELSNYVVTHIMIEKASNEYSFYWSTYDLSLVQAMKLFNEKTGD